MKNPFESKETLANKAKQIKTVDFNNRLNTETAKNLETIKIHQLQSTSDEIKNYVNKQENLCELVVNVGTDNFIVWCTPEYKRLFEKNFRNKLLTYIKLER